MNRNLKRALKYRMPTDAEMEAMGCRYLTDEELNELCGGRMVKDDPSTDNVSEVRAEGRDYGSSGSASSSGSSLGGSSGKTSGSSSSGRGSSYGSGTESSAGRGSAFGNLSGGSYGRGGGAGDNSSGGTNESSSSDTKEKSRDRDSGGSSGKTSGSSKEHTISSGETLAGITREHFPDLHGQDFVDKVHEIAKENGISNINEINAGDTISISGGKGASAWTGRGGGSSAGSSGAGNSSGGHGADSVSSSGCAGGGGYAGGTYGGSGQGAGSTTGTTAIEEAPTSATTPTDETQNPTSATSAATDAKDAKSSKGGFWGGVAAIGNGVKAFFNDPIGTMKGWLGSGESAVGRTEISNNVTTAKNSESKNTKTMSFPVDQSISRVTSKFGHREEISTAKGKTKAGHGGIDFAAPQGTPVTSAMDGWVKDKGYVEDGYGNYVVIGENSDSWAGDLTYYAHLENPSSVGVGEYVSQGQQIGTVGDTGKSTGPHLHFETRTDWGGTKHDPRDYLPFP